MNAADDRRSRAAKPRAASPFAHLAVIPVVVVSARDLHGNQERALKAGAKAYVQKPWSDTELLAIVGQLLGEPDVSVSQPA